MLMRVVVVMMMPVRMVMPVHAAIGFVMISVTVRMVMMVVMLMRDVDIKLHTGNGGLLLARNVKVIAVELELLQFTLELVRIHAEINQCGDEHVAGNAADEVEIERFHLCEASALICEAA